MGPGTAAGTGCGDWGNTARATALADRQQHQRQARPDHQSINQLTFVRSFLPAGNGRPSIDRQQTVELLHPGLSQASAVIAWDVAPRHGMEYLRSTPNHLKLKSRPNPPGARRCLAGPPRSTALHRPRTTSGRRGLLKVLQLLNPSELTSWCFFFWASQQAKAKSNST
jgi:hypothetical protein